MEMRPLRTAPDRHVQPRLMSDTPPPPAAAPELEADLAWLVRFLQDPTDNDAALNVVRYFTARGLEFSDDLQERLLRAHLRAEPDRADLKLSLEALLARQGRSLADEPVAGAGWDEALEHLLKASATPERAAAVTDAVIERLVAPFHTSLTWGDRLLTLDKSAGFRSDPAFKSAFDRMTTDTGQTQYSDPDGIAWRLNTLVWAARNGLALEGDFVECGVYQGQMSWLVTQTVDVAGSGKDFYLYDTFDGFAPAWSSAETDTPDDPRAFELHDAAYRNPELYPSVCRLFEDAPYAKVIKGVVPDVLHEISPRRIAYLHLDMNSPGPEIAALEMLFDRVASGAAIVLDDYGWTVFAAQKRAHDAWFAERGYTVLELPTGQGLVVKR